MADPKKYTFAQMNPVMGGKPGATSGKPSPKMPMMPALKPKAKAALTVQRARIQVAAKALTPKGRLSRGTSAKVREGGGRRKAAHRAVRKGL